jgi:hypothetical protein
MTKPLLSVLSIPALLLFISLACLQAQERPEREFRITKVDASFESSPDVRGPTGKSSRMRTNWMMIEVIFEWQNKARAGADGEVLGEFLDELELDVYALLNTRASATEQAALVSGKTTLLHVPQDRNLVAAMFISPRLLEQLFKGPVSGSPSSALLSRDSLGAALKYGGQVVATFPPVQGAAKPFWEDLAQFRLSSEVMRTVEGGILPRWHTPFASSNWNFYQQEKVGQ